MERADVENNNEQLHISSSSSGLIGERVVRKEWPTIDGPLGLSSEHDSIWYARYFFIFGFFFLPLLWAVNCYLFWPVLRHSPRSFPLLRPYIVRSAIAFAVFTAVLGSWAVTFIVGGERLFGHTWDELVMYNVADKYGLTGWI